MKYAMTNRPMSIGAYPDGWVRIEPRPQAGDPWHPVARHGFLVFDEELGGDVAAAYELVPVLPVDTIADMTSDAVCDWAQEYAEAYEDDPDGVADAIVDTAQRLFGASAVVITNRDKFTRAVLNLGA